MDVFVGAEYIIANALIALKAKGIDQIKFSELHDLGIEIQKICNEKAVDAVLLLSGNNVTSAIYSFSDYFTYIDDDIDPSIQLNSSKDIIDLQNRFIGYLPVILLKIIYETAKAFYNV
ncbi:MAG: hypothetical protein FWG88_10455 [Oscillospiraceae bacterium]|nr:hypothetical protein [Oscillospiraceae bacterium]